MISHLQEIVLKSPQERLQETIQFYTNLGFQIVEQSDKVYLNLFSSIGLGIRIEQGIQEPISFTLIAPVRID
jgi:catechol 2,3-dioxygenase-like lactoylglutathione lyase family enzyme